MGDGLFLLLFLVSLLLAYKLDWLALIGLIAFFLKKKKSSIEGLINISTRRYFESICFVCDIFVSIVIAICLWHCWGFFN